MRVMWMWAWRPHTHSPILKRARPTTLCWWPMTSMVRRVSYRKKLYIMARQRISKEIPMRAALPTRMRPIRLSQMVSLFWKRLMRRLLMRPTPHLPIEQASEDDQEHDRSEAGADLQVIPHSELRIVSVDSETLVGDGAADSAIDGRVETFWQTARGSRVSLHPHELVIALGGEYMVRGFRYLPRQDGKTDGMVGRYSFYVRQDGEEWGKAVTTGSFSRDITEQQVTFPEKAGSFVRFVAHSEVNGKPWTSVAEINILAVR